MLIRTTSTRAVLVIVGISSPLVKTELVELSGKVDVEQKIRPGPHLVAKLRKFVVENSIGGGPEVGAERHRIGVTD